MGMASKRQIFVGGVPIGGGAPVVVQTMTKTETANLQATLDQILRVADAGADIVRCADRIHSDLARGFIRAEVVNHGDYVRCHNMNEARKNGFVKLVEKGYVVQPGDILDIRFNV